MGDTVTITARTIRFVPGGTTISEPWPFACLTPPAGLYLFDDVKIGPTGSTLFAYNLVDYHVTQTLNVQAFDGNNVAYPPRQLGAWDNVDMFWIAWIGALVSNETVYACCVKADPGNPYTSAVYVEAFPLSDIMDAPDDYILHPSSFRLSAYPNPFNAQATISIDLPHSGRATLTIVDITGREVASIADRVFPAGTHEVRFDASRLPSGVYIASLHFGSAFENQKLVLLR